jgi:hypothetical protein
MFEALLLASVLLIVIGQLLPEEEDDQREDRSVQMAANRTAQVHYRQHKLKAALPKKLRQGCFQFNKA